MNYLSSQLLKRLLLIPFLNVFAILAYAQNVGIGTTTPSNKLEVLGNLVIKSETIAAKNTATPAQTFNLINGTNTNLFSADSVFRFYDPGGPSGNYVANLTASALISGPSSVYGFEFQIEQIQLGIGDSLIVLTLGGIRLLAVGNNYSSAGSYSFQGTAIIIQFKSNADASVGTGFSLLIQKLYLDQHIEV